MDESVRAMLEQNGCVSVVSDVMLERNGCVSVVSDGGA
jgi:uncharacterized membrane protein YcaP (DUF421 family)